MITRLNSHPLLYSMPKINRRESATSLFLLTSGALISAFGVAAFLVPSNVAGPGVLGIATILNYLLDIPIGVVTIIANIPIQLLGFRYLGGIKVVLGTLYYILMFSIIVDILTPIFHAGLTENILLAALFGGVLNGLGGGLVYRAGGTMGGTSTLARILQIKLGAPLSTTGLYTDMLVMVAAGIVFSWEAALTALLSLFIGGVASDYVLEGPSVIRTAMIVTDRPANVEQAIGQMLNREITLWHSEKSVRRNAHAILFVTISRPEVNDLTNIVSAVDPDSFVVITQGQAAYGAGFKPLKKRLA